MTDAATTPVKPVPAEDDAKKRRRALVETMLAAPAVTRHGEVKLAGRRMEYDTRLDFIPVTGSAFTDAGGEPEAAVFTTAYALKGAEAKQRPVCFAFNGGPGSASVWLHLGALGPKRVETPEDGSMPRPPYAVSDNPHSWFEHFDLVFVDPPHTGYSLASGEEARKKLLGVDGDVEALAEVVRTWLGRNQRWNSPVYLAGESYGTTRGAALADRLQSLGVALSGLILVSCAMDLQSIVFAPRNDLPYALFLPAFANVAQYHGRLKGAIGASPKAARRAAEAFVEDDYLRALHRGAALDGKARERIVRRIAELTGLSPAFVAEKNLRVSDQDFFFELLRDQGRIVGRLDARVTGPMAAARTRDWEFDPGMESITAPYTMAALGYMSRELGFVTGQRYEFLSMEVNQQWNWNRGDAKGNAFASTSADLARALRRNPHLKVLVASGHYDLGTPYSASDWSLAQLDAAPPELARIEHHYYDAGHMMYTREADLVKLKKDLVAWLGKPA